MNSALPVVQKLIKEKLQVATAESCTGGLLAAAITEIPGSSQVFGCGIVSYSNQIKSKVLGVDEQLLKKYGAVSPQVACAMAEGLRSLSLADICISITGIAGPDGGTTDKPVGLVYIGVADKNGVIAIEHRFVGGRQDIRLATVNAALSLISSEIEDLI